MAGNLLHLRIGGRLRAICVSCLIIPFLGGCTFYEPRPGLDFAIPNAYQNAKAASGPYPSYNWPRLFGSEELGKLSAQAVESNLDIAAAAARILQAEAQARISSAPLYPTLNATADASRDITPGTARRKTGPFKTTAGNLFALGLTANYEVDLWGRNAFNSEASKDLALTSRFDRDAVQLATSAALANTYFGMLAAQDRLRIAHENLKTASRVLDAIKGRLTVGTATELEVSEQESVVAQQRASIPPLEQQILQAKNSIAVLVGRTPESVRVRGGSLNRLKPPRVAPGLPSSLLVRRPDIAAAEERLASSDASVQAARAAFLPTISLTGRAGIESALLRTLLRPDAIFASAAAGLTQPLFDGYNLAGQLELARGRNAELLEDYRKSVIQAFSDVENALIAVQWTTEHEHLQALSVAASRRAYDITEQRLREGTIDIVTVLNTQQTLFQAQDNLVQVRLARFQALSSLFQALGGGWSKDAAVQAGTAGTAPGSARPS